VLASLAIFIWNRWTEGLVCDIQFMDVILKLEKSMIEDSLITAKLSEFFNQVLNYIELNCCYAFTEEAVNREIFTVISQVAEAAKLLQVGNRKTIGDEQEFDAKDKIKMSFTMTLQEKRKLYLLRREKRRRKFRKRMKKIKKCSLLVLDVEEEAHKIAVKMKKSSNIDVRLMKEEMAAEKKLIQKLSL
jgi:hypothetical protein